ncbi:MAG TPA: response regulator [Candidatus Dormibacteraeota bacterium]|nr:response regulator [Candidatus Dormibacteraeota bacterium]
MSDPWRLLLIDDNADDRFFVRRALARELDALEVHEAGDAETLARALETGPFDLVITDYALGFTNGFILLDTLKARWPECPVILCSGTLSEEIAVEALRKGLDDYVLKDPQRLLRLPAAVRGAIAHARQRAAARAAESRYEALFHGAPVGLVRSLPDGRMLAANAAAARIWGYPDVAALLQVDARELYVDPEDRARLVAAVEGSDAVQDFELRGRRGDGTLFWVNLGVRAEKDAGGRVLHYEWSVADITERKRLESELRQAQKLEAIGQLAGGVAHDFNNLLTVITGRSHLALGQLPPDHAVRRHIDLIQTTAERAAALTRQLLAFSRKQVLELKVLDLNASVTGLASMLRRLIGENLEFAVVAAPGLGPVKADPSQLEQVIVNLAVNARDAMPQGGKLTIETANVELDEAYTRRHPGASAGRFVMLAISDTGHGMDAAVKARIFEPFFTTKEPGKGTGLGLATVFGIVKQSGGSIWVYSEPGQGTTFKVYLPRVEAPVDRLAPASAPTLAPGSETILLVEDDDEVRALARETLDGNGYTVISAAAPTEALRLAGTHSGPIHLLVTDVVLPQLSGRGLAERLTPDHRDLRVLYMSGYTDDAVVRHGMLEEGTLFLQKPFTPYALLLKVREVLDQRA